MRNVFLEICNNAVTAGWLILAVVLLRPLFRKAPSWTKGILWLFVGIRLIFPIRLESQLSLVPVANPIPYEIVSMEAPQMFSELPLTDGAVASVPENTQRPEKSTGRGLLQIWLLVPELMWIAGMVVLLGYALISYVLLRRQVEAMAVVEEGVCQYDGIGSPFVMGILRPVVYLPSGMEGETVQYVLAHEKMHIRRGDHIWKPLGFLLLTVYWFHPLCWVAYILLCKDIELACDEKVTRGRDKEWKARYCEALLTYSMPKKIITACPVAFGEVSVKTRIRSVLRYKKPAFWVIALSVTTCVAVAVCFMTNPLSGAGGDGPTSVFLAQKPDGPTSVFLAEPAGAAENTTENRSAEPAGTAQNAVLDPLATQTAERWAQAFSERDARTIMQMASDSVQKAFRDAEWLDGFGDEASFGFSSPMLLWDGGVKPYQICAQDDASHTVDILYYAWTSDPHVSVWREQLTLQAKDGSYQVVGEKLFMDEVSTGGEYQSLYPYGINETLMDYTRNGLGMMLEENALLSESFYYRDLLEPLSAVRMLLNLSADEKKVKVEQIDSNTESVDVKITFLQDNSTVTLSMIQPYGPEGIWLVQDRGMLNLPWLTQTQDENLSVTYEETEGGYVVEGDMVYLYKKVLEGRDPGAAKKARMVVLTNDPDVTFEQVSRSLYSSNSRDFLPDTLLIGIRALEE